MQKFLKVFCVAGLLAGLVMVSGCGGGGGGAAAEPQPNEPVGIVDVYATNVANVPPNDDPYDASTEAVTFNVVPPLPATFTYNIDGFGVGDHLVFVDGTALSLINVNGTDGIIDVLGLSGGQTVTMHLTGIDVESDAALFGGSSFNDVFGAGALGPSDIANVSVTTVNAPSDNPYDASLAAVAFTVHPNSMVHPDSMFTYNIAKFADGDKLIFADGAIVQSVLNLDGTDGMVDVIATSGGVEVTVHLTGIAAASDSAIRGINTFKAEFGPDSLVSVP